MCKKSLPPALRGHGEPATAALGRELESPGVPVALRVGLLGEGYGAWVHRPVTGAPRFFRSDALENITRCPWWAVPCVWLPLLTAYGLMYGGENLEAPLSKGLPNLMLGIVLWQLLEYSIHRFLFHVAPSSYWGITLHFLFHGNHHKWPSDKMRLVFPPLPAIGLGAAIHAGLRAMLSLDDTAGLFMGIIIGYVAYDLAHYFIHHGDGGRFAFLAAIRSSHLRHHFKEPGTGYGISSTTFDYVFGTAPKGD